MLESGHWSGINIWNNALSFLFLFLMITLLISQLQCSWLHSSTANAECRSFCYINKLWIWSNSSSYRRIMLSHNRYNCKYLQKIQSAYFLFVPKLNSNILKHPPSVDGSPGLPRRPLGFPRWPRCLHRCNGHCKSLNYILENLDASHQRLSNLANLAQIMLLEKQLLMLRTTAIVIPVYIILVAVTELLHRRRQRQVCLNLLRKIVLHDSVHAVSNWDD
jgi:hypothetical protein